MVRTIITPEDTHIELDIPKEYVGKRLEITYQSLEEVEPKSTTKGMLDFVGILSDISADGLKSEIEKIRKEWE